MGKNFQGRDSLFPIQNKNPGCMWGVLQIVKYHRWRLLKKRNSQRGTGNEGNCFNASESDRCPLLDTTEKDFNKAEKINDTTPGMKGPVKSRIKALVSDDLHKKKDQLRRSSSYPALSRRLVPADGNLLRSVTVKHIRALDDLDLNNKGPTTPKKNANNSEVQNSEHSDGMTSTDNKSRHDEVEETREESVEDNNVVPWNSDRKQSVVNARELLDALDLMNTNKELLLKLLQDPSSPLVHHFHSEQALSSRRKFTKSTSFSLSSAPSLRGPGPMNLNSDQKGIAPDVVEPNSKKFVRQASMPTIAPEYKRRNHVVMNRFKDLKHKLKHMIKQNNNNEKHRVAMDGILHRIPHGKEVPRDFKKDIVDQAKKQGITKEVKESLKSSSESDNSLPTPIKTGKRFSRTSSLKESLDRYCQLYESSFNRESKQTSKLRSEDATPPQANLSKSIRRIYSSPDLSYYPFLSEDFPNVYTSPVRKALDTAIISEHSDTEGEVKADILQNLDFNHHTVDQTPPTASFVEPETKSSLVSDDSGNSVAADSAFHEKQDAILSSETVTETEEPHMAVPDSKFPEDTEDLKPSTGPMLPDMVDSSKELLAESVKDAPIESETTDSKQEIPSKHLEHEAEAKGKAEYDYVRDVLHLSGFSGSELLGAWHSDDQPLDPSMLEEMDSTLFNSESFGVEEGYPCYNLLLFDLINQVLMEIYAKCYTYYPSPLCSLSRIHPMPEGRRVFNEVWASISWYLSFNPESDQLLDYIASRDLAKKDGWMNLQFDCECVAMEVDDMIFDDLLDEIVFDDLSVGMIVDHQFEEVVF